MASDIDECGDFSAEKSYKGCGKTVKNAFVSCINCTSFYHNSCASKVAELKKKDNGKVIYCGSMVMAKGSAGDELAILKKENDLMKRLLIEMDEKNELLKEANVLLREKISFLERGGQKGHGMEGQRQSYAEVFKKTGTLIIKSDTNEKGAKEIVSELHTLIKPSDLKIGIEKVKNIGNKNVAVVCESMKDMEVLRNEVQGKIRDCSVETAVRKKSCVKIVGITERMEPDQLKSCILNQNLFLKDCEIIVKAIYLPYANSRVHTAIIEVDDVGFERIMDRGKLRLGWSVCGVYEHIEVYRCFKCCGYFHKAVNCKNLQACRNCALEHAVKDCDQKTKKCINCVSANAKFGLKLNVEHSAFDTSCEVYKRQLTRQKSRIAFNTTK